MHAALAAASGPGQNPIAIGLMVLVLGFAVAGNLTLMGLTLAGRLRGKSYFSPAWSIADLFVALQAVFLLLIFGAVWCFALIVAVGPRGIRSAEDLPPTLEFWGLLFPLMALQQIALVGVPVGVVALKYRQGFAELGLRLPDAKWWRQFGLGAACLVPLFPAVDLIQVLCQRVIESGRLPFTHELQQMAKDADALTMLGDIRSQPLSLLAMGLIVGVIGPIAEEVFFRGFAHRVLRQRFGVLAGAGVSALLFAAIHGNPVALVPIFAIGLILAALYQRTGSLAAPMGLHIANNCAALALFLFAPADFGLWDRVIPKF